MSVHFEGGGGGGREGLCAPLNISISSRVMQVSVVLSFAKRIDGISILC